MSQFSKCIDRSITSITDNQLYGATTIRNYAFDSCRSLTSIIIPNSVTSIGSYAFDGCTNLTDCTIFRSSAIVTLGSSNFNATTNKIYVPYSLLSNYKTATNWVGISDKIMGYQTFALNEILPRYNTTHTFTWYPSKADLILKTNGIVANGTNRATSAGVWYCNRPRIEVNLISNTKTTSFVRPTSSSNATQTQYITLNTPPSGSSNILITGTITDYVNDNGTSVSYNDESLPKTFNHPNNSSYKLEVSYYSSTQLRVNMKGNYSSFGSEYWQQLTITSAIQVFN